MLKFIAALALTIVGCSVLAWYVPWFKHTAFTWQGIGFAPVFFVFCGGLAVIYSAIKGK